MVRIKHCTFWRFGNRVGLQIGEANFMKPALWYERKVFEKGVIHSFVAGENAFIYRVDIWLLQIGIPTSCVEEMLLGFEDAIGIAMNVNEAGIGEDFEDGANARRVGWGGDLMSKVRLSFRDSFLQKLRKASFQSSTSCCGTSRKLR